MSKLWWPSDPLGRGPMHGAHNSIKSNPHKKKVKLWSYTVVVRARFCILTHNMLPYCVYKFIQKLLKLCILLVLMWMARHSHFLRDVRGLNSPLVYNYYLARSLTQFWDVCTTNGEWSRWGTVLKMRFPPLRLSQDTSCNTPKISYLCWACNIYKTQMCNRTVSLNF